MYRKKPEGWAKHIDFILWDLLCLQAAFVIAYMMRHGMRSPYLNADYRGIAIIFSLVDLIVIFFFDTMRNVRKRGYFKELTITIEHVLLVEVIITFYLFAVQAGETYSRFTFYMTGILYICLTYLVRIAWKAGLKDYRPLQESRILLVTTFDKAKECLQHLKENRLDPVKVSGAALVDRDDTADMKIENVPVVAGAAGIAAYLCREWVDEVFVMLPIDSEDTRRILDQCAEMGITTHLALARASESQNIRQTAEQLSGYVMLTSSVNIMSIKQAFAKRFLDILGGAAGCLITCLLTLILAPLIYINSPGPIFFSQERIGKNGKKFKMYKFRSMYLDAEERKKELLQQNRIKDGMMFKLDFDPRIIGSKLLPDGTIKKGIGNFIRDWSLDEFPQFFNVLKGNMSLVGTRPPTVDEWEKYELHHRARLCTRPGITGLWQVSGRSEITDFEEVVRLDRKYISEWSLGLDLKILLQTLKVVLGKNGAM